jgi:hypothetical protein
MRNHLKSRSAVRQILAAAEGALCRKPLFALVQEYFLLGKWKTASAMAEALIAAYPPEEGHVMVLPLERLGSRFAFAVLAFSLDSWRTNNVPSTLIPHVNKQMERVELELKKREALGHLMLTMQYFKMLRIFTAAAVAQKEMKRDSRLPGSLQGLLLESLLIAASVESELFARLSGQIFCTETRSQKRSFRALLKDARDEALENPWEPQFWDFREADRYEALAAKIRLAEPEDLSELVAQVSSQEIITKIHGVPVRVLEPLLNNQSIRRTAIDLPAMLS